VPFRRTRLPVLAPNPFLISFLSALRPSRLNFPLSPQPRFSPLFSEKPRFFSTTGARFILLCHRKRPPFFRGFFRTEPPLVGENNSFDSDFFLCPIEARRLRDCNFPQCVTPQPPPVSSPYLFFSFRLVADAFFLCFLSRKENAGAFTLSPPIAPRGRTAHPLVHACRVYL